MLFVLETWDRGQRPRDREIRKGSERAGERQGKKKMESVREMEEERRDRETEKPADTDKKRKMDRMTERRREKVES